MGRILRPKKNAKKDEIQARFYSLVSTGTDEEAYSNKRGQFLKAQGYEYRQVQLTNLSFPDTKLSSKHSQMTLLRQILENSPELSIAEPKSLKRKKTNSDNESFDSDESRGKTGRIPADGISEPARITSSPSKIEPPRSAKPKLRIKFRIPKMN
jgi:superfamily II DNA or RNA helicase